MRNISTLDNIFITKKNPKYTSRRNRTRSRAGKCNRYSCGVNINREKVNPRTYTYTFIYKLKYSPFWSGACAFKPPFFGFICQSTHTHTPTSTEPLHITVLTFDFETRTKRESYPSIRYEVELFIYIRFIVCIVYLFYFYSVFMV